MEQIKIKNKIIADDFPAFIVAEMAWSHDGLVEKAKKIVRATSDAKADAIKFHITSVEDYMVPQYGSGKGRVSAGKEERSIYEYLKSINLDRKAWEELFSYTKGQGLLICAMCNDLASFRFASKLDPDIYDVHSSCLSDEDFIREVAKDMKPVFLGIGASTLGEIERAISWAKETGNNDISLIYGFQSYPTRLEDMHLRYIQSLKQMFSLPVGFADHTDGGSDLALITPLVALPYGANIIEKHVTYDRSARGEDFESALDPGDLKKLVQLVREVEKAFGSPTVRPLSEGELNYRQVSKKRAVAKVKIKKDEKITKDNIAFKRSDEGVYPEESKFLIGRTAKCDIEKDEGLTWERIY